MFTPGPSFLSSSMYSHLARMLLSFVIAQLPVPSPMHHAAELSCDTLQNLQRQLDRAYGDPYALAPRYVTLGYAYLCVDLHWRASELFLAAELQLALLVTVTELVARRGQGSLGAWDTSWY
ncbi:hypothetical protein MSAN_00845400 [Mycena sanguinolenta]|uniref:Transcription factor domain-containing protein n=1 Tax=Mycena sanguinolenta TaxID=230812 RepID=A0A8H7DDR4_9AGAR|nr:hypothetical protein MSAN_00845400 [Mycena sanguinolenta]